MSATVSSGKKAASVRLNNGDFVKRLATIQSQTDTSDKHTYRAAASVCRLVSGLGCDVHTINGVCQCFTLKEKEKSTEPMHLRL